MSHCYPNLWLPKPIFQHSLVLNLWPYATEMWDPVCLRGTALQVSVATTSLLRKWLPRRPQTFSADCIFQRTENMVVGRRQIRAVWWMRPDSPLKLCDGLSGMQTGVWPRIVVVKRHSVTYLWGRTLLKRLFRVSTVSKLIVWPLSNTFMRITPSRHERRSDTLPCPCSDDANRFHQRQMVLFIHRHVSIDVC
jgi:hypothetical protein